MDIELQEQIRELRERLFYLANQLRKIDSRLRKLEHSSQHKGKSKCEKS